MRRISRKTRIKRKFKFWASETIGINRRKREGRRRKVWANRAERRRLRVCVTEGGASAYIQKLTDENCASQKCRAAKRAVVCIFY